MALELSRRQLLMSTGLLACHGQGVFGQGVSGRSGFGQSKKPKIVDSIGFCPTSDGRKVEYRILGDTQLPPVVYFSGCPSTFYELDMNWNSLQLDRYCWIGINRPGTGRSSFDPNMTLESFAADMRHVLQDLLSKHNWNKCRLLGYSGGAPFALACAQLTDLISRIALVSSAPVDGAVFSKNALKTMTSLALRTPRLAKPILKLIFNRIGRRGISDRTLNSFQRRGDFAAIDIRMIKQDPCLRKNMGRGFAYVSACGVEGIRHELRLLACPWKIDFNRVANPIDIWHGQLDCNSNYSNSLKLNQRMEGSNLNLFPCEGHLTIWIRQMPTILSQLFDPDETNKAIDLH